MLILKVYKQLHQREGTKKDGTSFKVNYQEAEIIRQGHRPRLVEISAPRSGPHVEGLYTLDQSSFRPDMYDRLSLAPFLKLMPLNDAIAIASAEENGRASKQITKKAV